MNVYTHTYIYLYMNIILYINTYRCANCITIKMNAYLMNQNYIVSAWHTCYLYIWLYRNTNIDTFELSNQPSQNLFVVIDIGVLYNFPSEETPANLDAFQQWTPTSYGGSSLDPLIGVMINPTKKNILLKLPFIFGTPFYTPFTTIVFRAHFVPSHCLVNRGHFVTQTNSAPWSHIPSKTPTKKTFFRWNLVVAFLEVGNSCVWCLRYILLWSRLKGFWADQVLCHRKKIELECILSFDTHLLLILSSIRALPSGTKNTLQDNLQNQSSRKHVSCFCLGRCCCVNVAAISPPWRVVQQAVANVVLTCQSDSYGILSRF